jgi:DNA-binding beta-propeller fold protein YncE
MKRRSTLTPLILRLLVSNALSVIPLLVPMLLAPTLCAQQAAASTETPSSPFSIKSTWILGGTGSWDYLTMDPAAERLYIAHGHSVQVVDVKAGTLAGEISGLAEAHDIALDDTGEFGYVSDGLAGRVVVFDRRTLQTVAAIEGIPSPRALVFEPQTGLLFAVRTDPVPAPPTPSVPRTTTHIVPRPAPPPPRPPKPNTVSSIAVIDTQTRKVVAQILLPETLGFAQVDQRGNLFVNAPERNRILRFDAQTVASLLPKKTDGSADAALSGNAPGSGNASGAGNTPGAGNASDPASAPASASAPARPAKQAAPRFIIDWTQRQVRSFSLDGQCTMPKSLAIDSAHERLFAACNNMKLLVLDADSGQLVATLPIGPGVDAIGYDPDRGLIYAANGGADGSLTIISQSVTDGYAVIQTLPTRQRARTLAVNPETGQVYLVTDLLGVNLAANGGIGSLQTNPVNGSFQVLVVGQ